jgi:hypothetical protein
MCNYPLLREEINEVVYTYLVVHTALVVEVDPGLEVVVDPGLEVVVYPDLEVVVDPVVDNLLEA